MGLARRSFCFHSLVFGISLSGCISNPLGIERDGGILAILVEDVPDDVDVVAIDDPRLDDMPLVREMVNQAIQEGNTARTIEWETAERLDQMLKAELPYYRDAGMSGVYIRAGDTVVVVSIQFEG